MWLRVYVISVCENVYVFYFGFYVGVVIVSF